MAERYVGIDLNDKHAMISHYAKGMSEPGTFSMVTGSEVYQIPVCISRKAETGQWIYGEEAKRHAKEQKGACVDGLLKKALASEEVELDGSVYGASELLFLFIKKLLGFVSQGGGEIWPDKLVIAVENMNPEHRKLFGFFAEWLKIPSERLLLFDYRESFYYYALSQAAELCLHDAALYYYTTGKLFCLVLSHDRKTKPQIVTIEETHYEAMLKEKDEKFAKIVEHSLSGKIISSIYLIGDGFDGEWMKKSLSVICRGRRAFMGKNLFSKGACYGAAVKSDHADWDYVYMGDNELKINISLKLENQEKTEFFSLITAGENWYEAHGECEVILIGTPVIDFWFQAPRSKEAVVRSLELGDMPEREDKTTRLRITAKPVAVDRIKLSIMDMGFGEIAKSSEKVWEYTIAI